MTRRRAQRMEVGLEELREILERAAPSLTESDLAKLRAAVDTLALVTSELESQGASLDRLRRMLFGARTETTAEVLKEQGDGSDPGRGKHRDAREAKPQSRAELHPGPTPTLDAPRSARRSPHRV